jgi:DNA polymerase V
LHEISGTARTVHALRLSPAIRTAPVNPRKTIPIVIADTGGGDCAGAESFALLVLGDSMAPEFVEGEVIIVEPDGLASDGSFVVAQVDGEWTMRQLVAEAGGWKLRALNSTYP